MNINTDTLTEIASAVAGRDVAVTFRNSYMGDMRIEGCANDTGIQLSRHAFSLTSPGDPCFTFFHELGHTLYRHAGRQVGATDARSISDTEVVLHSDQAEREADAFAQEALRRAGRMWWENALRGYLVSSERAEVIADIQAAWAATEPAFTGKRAVSTPTANRSAIAPQTDARQTDTRAMENQVRSEIRLCEEVQKRGGSTRLQRLIINSAEGKIDALEAMDNPSKRAVMRYSEIERRPLASVYETR